MLDETIIPDRNVVDFHHFRKLRAARIEPRLCRYCGASLGDGEIEEDCSGAWPTSSVAHSMTRRRFSAD